MEVLLNFIITKLDASFFLSIVIQKCDTKCILVDVQGLRRQNKMILTLLGETIKIVVKYAIYFMLPPRVRVDFRH